MFLIQKYTQYKAAQAEQQKRKVTEKELAHLNHKIVSTICLNFHQEYLPLYEYE